MAAELYASIDAVVKPAAFKAFKALGWEVKQTPVSKGMLFVDSPTPTLLCLGAYLVLVSVWYSILARKPAQKEKDKRPDPMWLKLLILAHNVFLVSLSAFMSGGIVYHAVKSGYSVWGNAFKPSEKDMAWFIWVFYISKIYEFIDTVIMLLKGNLQQVSVLHVYHHASISIIWWMITHTAPGGDAYFSAALNSFVHVVMYTYYLLAILLGKNEQRRKKYLFWGRYLTQFQMAQFVTNMVQAAYCLMLSPYPSWLSKLLLRYMVTLLILFGTFYYKKHVAGASGKSGAGSKGRTRAKADSGVTATPEHRPRTRSMHAD